MAETPCAVRRKTTLVSHILANQQGMRVRFRCNPFPVLLCKTL